MCGVTGVLAFDEKGKELFPQVNSATQTLQKRGPDHQEVYQNNDIALGHARLSIIDTSSNGNQPFIDPSKRFILVFNGEFYNYKEHRKNLELEGINFKSSSDTEVLLYLLIKEGTSCLKKINGFFSFAFYDIEKKEMILARDRFGIKPLYYLKDDHKFIFGSEIKSLLAFEHQNEIDKTSLYTYLQLNYIPSPHSIFEKVKKIPPGSCMVINQNGTLAEHSYYELESPKSVTKNVSYHKAKNKLIELLEESVNKRMISDVPLGSFLSGGIDSSIITAIAASNSSNSLNTFSIGYQDEPFYDETKYAELVANKYDTNHSTYLLTNDDLLNHLFEMLDYIDEPFADSSALAVNILCKKTKQKVSVALSGDGADEIFSGYNKHKAEFFIRNNKSYSQLIKAGMPLWKLLPHSRGSKFTNLFRQLHRLSEGAQLSKKDRYWRWASFQDKGVIADLLLSYGENENFENRKNLLLEEIVQGSDFNEILKTDVKLVLENDMLTKVDRMSMNHGLEVRVPFLDHNVVDYAFQLPVDYKIDQKQTKKVLRDAFRHYLPKEIYERSKHGFEVPLLKWFKNELNSLIEEELLSEKFIKNQCIFDYKKVKLLKDQLYSRSSGDAVTGIWSLIVFNYWWKKYFL